MTTGPLAGESRRSFSITSGTAAQAKETCFVRVEASKRKAQTAAGAMV